LPGVSKTGADVDTVGAEVLFAQAAAATTATRDRIPAQKRTRIHHIPCGPAPAN
jgi:hypothetical protein